MTADLKDVSKVGVVAIGRNEGERLRACLTALKELGLRVVYVDSASSDGSAGVARGLGAEVVELDMTRPFSAARARNEGFARLREVLPGVEWVQFVDGDCVLAAGWIEAAVGYLEQEARVAVVCGRRRERFPNASIYNRLCDMEWNTPVEARACGGDAMMRVAAFLELGGFDPATMAGEEPDLCFRLRQAGWRIFRLDHEMTLHDAAIMRFGQYWKRTVRGGFGLGQLAHLARERKAEEAFPTGRLKASALFWGVGMPTAFLVFAVAGAFFPYLWIGSGVVFLMVLALLAKCWRYRRSKGDSAGGALLYALFVLAVKAAVCRGMWLFRRSLRGRGRAALIEYKGTGK